MRIVPLIILVLAPSVVTAQEGGDWIYLECNYKYFSEMKQKWSAGRDELRFDEDKKIVQKVGPIGNWELACDPTNVFSKCEFSREYIKWSGIGQRWSIDRRSGEYTSMFKRAGTTEWRSIYRDGKCKKQASPQF